MNQLFHISFSEPMAGHPGFQAFLKVLNTISLFKQLASIGGIDVNNASAAVTARR